MMGRRNSCSLFRLSAFVLFGVCPAFGNVVYVDKNATGANNGTSWANAYTDLQDGLADCANGVQVYVAEGTYTPDDCDPTCDRSASFVLDDVTCDLAGGFATGGGAWDPDTYVTILSGDNAGNDPTVTDNAYHVLYVDSNITNSSGITGFTITGGVADTGSDVHAAGADIRGGPEIKYMKFDGNYATYNGAGISSSGDAYIHHCVFTDNTSGVGGVGGGAMIGGETKVENCLFANNGGGVAAGGIGIANGTGDGPTIENCTIVDNFLGAYPVGGGGIWITSTAGATTIHNTIVWGNDSSDLSGTLTSLTITHSDIDGGCSVCGDAGDYNIDADPGFASGDCSSYHITDDSPCNDAGEESCPFGDDDLCYDHPRCLGEYVDIGAHESGCLSNDDCDGDPDGEYCNTSTDRCVECLVAADCPMHKGCGKFCAFNTCHYTCAQ